MTSSWVNGKEDILRVYDGCMISLGYSCTVKRFLEKDCRMSTVQYPFDYIGSSAWSLMALFEKLCDTDSLPLTLIHMKTEHTIELQWVWKDFYLRVLHHFDTGSEGEIGAFRGHLKRRMKRLDDLLRSNSRVLMVRLEEYMGDRILDPDHEEKHRVKTELEYLQELQEYLGRTYPETTVHLIFITTLVETPTYDTSRRIICLPMLKGQTYTWFDETAVPELFDLYGVFLKRCLVGESDVVTGRRIMRVRYVR